ncbi:NUDIX hydrolase [Kitasatospora sp. CM 4170]|uniref:NUDIX hydrolase n=1 Tax=Kitasatospora aburaviensis TaxID=67265 RepID=A0ABW1EWV1_9ACTN|nr:NUDIX hydrolase [Kitasatospora sp. CM 4170]WNM43811.1 NUDIX hydrolase [Kitasatospora sp. CM 4170]
MDVSQRRAERLAAYQKLAAERPHLFENPEDAPFRILLDPAAQNEVADAAAELALVQGLPEEFGDIGVVYQDRYVTVVRDAVLFPSGVSGAYVRVCPTGDGVGAAVLPVLHDGRVVLVRHFRHADRQWHWEIPRGFGEPGEEGDATARREAEEELGCPVAEVLRLGAMEADAGMAATRTELYLARLDEDEFRTEPSKGARQEGIDAVRAVSPDELQDMLTLGQVTDSFTLSALALATACGKLR